MAKPATTKRWSLRTGMAARPSRRAWLVVASLASVAFLGASLWPHGSLEARVALGSLALVAGLAAMRRARAPSSPAVVGHLVADDHGLSRVTARGTTSLVRWDERIGVTLLTSAARDRVVIALTSPSAARYVVVEQSEPRVGAIASRACTVPEGDLLGAQSAGSIDEDAAEELLATIEARAPGALDRIFLTDTRGRLVSAERGSLAVGDDVVDLAAPFEWRPFMFHESAGELTMLYRATWVRQGAVELTFVTQLPTESASPRGMATQPATVEKRRLARRDAHLAQSLPDAPPPRDIRVGIDRPFLLPLRRVLDGAPAARLVQPKPPAPSRPTERRAH